MAEQILSRDNPLVKRACKLAGSGSARAEEGLFFAEGIKLCMDLAASCKAEMLFCTQEAYDAVPSIGGNAQKVYIISGPVAEKLSQTRTSQGVFGLFVNPDNTLENLDTQKGILFAENLQDPSNVGAVIRSAAAFGMGGVVFTAGSADYLGPKALRASMGCALRIPVAAGLETKETADFLRSRGVTIYAAALDEGACSLDNLNPAQQFAVMVGNEGAGLTSTALACADQRIYIPMHSGVESLNASVAASVLMYDLKSKTINNN